MKAFRRQVHDADGGSIHDHPFGDRVRAWHVDDLDAAVVRLPAGAHVYRNGDDVACSGEEGLEKLRQSRYQLVLSQADEVAATPVVEVEIADPPIQVLVPALK